MQTADLWDPEALSFSAAGDLPFGLLGNTATLLPDGRVLIVGGGTARAASEVWDPLEGSFARAPRLSTGRYGHASILLVDGGVLVVGGPSAAYAPNSISEWLERSAELLDPDTGRFRGAGRLAQGRSGHTATLLQGGRVVVLGGSGTDGLLASAEVWDPASERFGKGPPLAQARAGHTATLLENGRIIVLGGIGRQAGRRLVLSSGETWAAEPTSMPSWPG